VEDERKKLLSELTTMFAKDVDRKVFQRFIEYIRLPLFKNFEENIKIDFSFPVTFIVGQNGSGKSSLLHALYGCPRRNSTSRFWYNTALDPIKELKDNRNCLIYAFKTEFTKTQVEVWKTRIKREGDPDYWEPARPQKTYEMESPPSDVDIREVSGKGDRWNLVQRKVYYMDFRYSLSAYDQYFYFGSKSLKDKKRIIRKRAQKLKAVFDSNRGYHYYTMKAQKPIVLSTEELEVISHILGKAYVEAKIIEHDLYEHTKGFSVRYKTKGLNYSEAFAGSGETAVVKLVHEVAQAEDYGLVLLDEPETSLHPGAQKKLMNFILQQTKLKKLQVVIATHSPDLIEGMPKEAIKILYENEVTKKVAAAHNVYPSSAFIHVGRSYQSKKMIVVEDVLAQKIVKRVLKQHGEQDLFDVSFFPGGESRIKQESMVVYAKEEDIKHFILFDGDQDKGKLDPTSITDGDKNESTLKDKIKALMGQDITFSVDSNSGNQKVNLMMQYIQYHFANVFFLPKQIPEEIIWSDEVLNKADLSERYKGVIKQERDLKKRFNLFAKHMFGEDSNEYQIVAYEYFLEKWIQKDSEELRLILASLEKMKSA